MFTNLAEQAEAPDPVTLGRDSISPPTWSRS